MASFNNFSEFSDTLFQKLIYFLQCLPSCTLQHSKMISQRGRAPLKAWQGVLHKAWWGSLGREASLVPEGGERGDSGLWRHRGWSQVRMAGAGGPHCALLSLLMAPVSTWRGQHSPQTPLADPLGACMPVTKTILSWELPISMLGNCTSSDQKKKPQTNAVTQISNEQRQHATTAPGLEHF